MVALSAWLNSMCSAPRPTQVIVAKSATNEARPVATSSGPQDRLVDMSNSPQDRVDDTSQGGKDDKDEETTGNSSASFLFVLALSVVATLGIIIGVDTFVPDMDQGYRVVASSGSEHRDAYKDGSWYYSLDDPSSVSCAGREGGDKDASLSGQVVLRDPKTGTCYVGLEQAGAKLTELKAAADKFAADKLGAGIKLTELIANRGALADDSIRKVAVEFAKTDSSAAAQAAAKEVYVKHGGSEGSFEADAHPPAKVPAYVSQNPPIP
jgi:hypothetical protein